MYHALDKQMPKQYMETYKRLTKLSFTIVSQKDSQDVDILWNLKDYDLSTTKVRNSV